MAYNLTKADGTVISIADNAIDTTQTTIGLIGRNSINFGAIDNQNRLNVIENFSATVSPDLNPNINAGTGTAIEGQLWWDKGNKVMLAYDGTTWVSINSIGTGDFNPGGDLTSDLGTPILRWHNLYAGHGHFDTTGDGDGFPAIEITGDGILHGTGAITFDNNGGYTIGAPLFQLGDIYTINGSVSGIYTFGTAGIQGGTTGVDPAIIPSTGTVSLGIIGSAFDGVFGTLDVAVVTSNTGRIDVTNNADIVPANDKSSDLGKATERFRNIYAEDFYEDDDLGVATRLEDKYLAKIGITNIEGTLVLDNGTIDTPELVFSNSTGAPSFMYMDMNASQLRLIGNPSEAFPGSTPGSPRVIMTTDADTGEVRLANINTGGFSVPNTIGYNVRDTSNTTNVNGVRMNSVNNVEVGDITNQLNLRGGSAGALKYTVDDAIIWDVFHEGNPMPIPDDYVFTAGDEMSGTLSFSDLLNDPGVPTVHFAALQGNPIAFDDGDIKVTVHDGGGNFSIKGGVDDPGIIDKYRTTTDGAVKFTQNYSNTNGNVRFEVAQVASTVGAVAGDDINYTGSWIFGTQSDTGVMVFESEVAGINYTSQLYSSVFGLAITVLENLENNSAMFFRVYNGAGVNKDAVLWGQNDGSSVLSDGELQVAGDVVAFASDRRLKKNVKPIKDAVNKVKKLNGTTFEFNEVAEEAGFVCVGRQSGLFAQEVDEVLPEATRIAPFDIKNDPEESGRDSYMTVQYDKVIPLLVEAIKEQQQQIEDLNARISSLTR